MGQAENGYIRRNEKYLNKKDFEMGGDLPVQKGASSSPNSYELFSKSVVNFIKGSVNVNKKYQSKFVLEIKNSI